MTESSVRRRRTRRDPDRQRSYNLQRNYGITLDQYNAMRVAQYYRCAICRVHEDAISHRSLAGRPRHDGSVVAVESRSRLCVDHSHRSGAVRGLLCPNCNHLLGTVDDDVDLLRHAISYLERLAEDDEETP